MEGRGGRGGEGGGGGGREERVIEGKRDGRGRNNTTWSVTAASKIFVETTINSGW